MRFPTSNRLDGPGLIMIDFGARINGYAGDVTRTIRYGSIGKDEEKIVRTAIEANEKTKRLIKPEMKTSVVLRKNMVFTVEAGVCVPGIGGARVKDVVVIAEDGCRELTISVRNVSL